MKEKKYELTNETKVISGITFRRIRALQDIPHADVTVGDFGGWIEGEHNLSQDGDAWVSGNAVVYDKAKVYGKAVVSGNAEVCGDAEVCGLSARMESQEQRALSKILQGI